MMDFEFISEWLKNTVPGIILLGALGSFIAVIIARLFSKPLRILLYLPLRKIHKERLWWYWRSSTAYQHILEDTTNRKLIYFQFRHLSRLIIALCGLSVTLIILSIIVTLRTEVLLSYGTFFLSTALFLFGYWVWMEYEYLTINFVIEWRKTGLVKNPFPDGIEGIDKPFKSKSDKSKSNN
ncbi:MAG: hypothetical protein C0436_04665 [Alphaproteobacteria bacterium]|nr:hypothetical protein [Alphaproteobacteria bacterium]